MKTSNVALAIDSVLVKKKIDIIPVFKSLEEVYQMRIQASWSGITAHTPERRIYTHGHPTTKMATTPEQRTTYRLRLLKFLRWLYANNYTTAPLLEIKSWLEEQEEW